MSTLWQQVRGDLVDRRLLPIPVVLVVGMIAVPVLAKSHRSSADALPFTAPKSTQTTTAPTTTTPSKPHKSTHSRNPFPAASAASSNTTNAPAATSSPAAATSAPATPTVATPTTPSTPAPPSVTATPKPTRAKDGTRRWTITAIDLRFGAAVVPHIRRDVARLTPLPSNQAPVALLLGRLPGGHSVAFRISPGVTVTGEGTCVPRKTICSQLLLRPGNRVILTRPSGRKLRLELVRSPTSHTKSSKRARRAYRRVSAAGQCILDSVSAYRYDAETGLLHRTGIVAKGCHYADADSSGSLRGTR